MFLDSHPNDVILLVLEINNRADEDVDLDVFYGRGIEPVDGLVSKIYAHPDAETEWPTLLDMIASNEVSALLEVVATGFRAFPNLSISSPPSTTYFP